MIKYWIWKLLRLPYVMPPGEYIVKSMRAEGSRRVILDDVTLRGSEGGMTFLEYTESREVEV